MTDKMKIDLGNVQKTLFLPLRRCAVELKIQYPLLVDETTVNIIEQADLDFSQITQNLAEISQIGWIKEACMEERVVKEFLQITRKAPLSISGADSTSPSRHRSWVHAVVLLWMLPDVIKSPNECVKENERRKFISASFLAKQWQTFSLREGVYRFTRRVYYSEAETIKEFVIRLTDTYPNSESLFDVSSPLGVKIANKTVLENAGLNQK